MASKKQYFFILLSFCSVNSSLSPERRNWEQILVNASSTTGSHNLYGLPISGWIYLVNCVVLPIADIPIEGRSEVTAGIKDTLCN